ASAISTTSLPVALPISTEIGGFVEYDAEGVTLSHYRTINSVIARFKPGHWVCRAVKFEWQPSLISSALGFDAEPTTTPSKVSARSEEHTSELQSREKLV